jgi:hypothetical protein
MLLNFGNREPKRTERGAIELLGSPAENRTPVSLVTGEDTDHYTTKDLLNKKIKCITISE